MLFPASFLFVWLSVFNVNLSFLSDFLTLLRDFPTKNNQHCSEVTFKQHIETRRDTVMSLKKKSVPAIIFFADRKIQTKRKMFWFTDRKSQYHIFKSMIYKWYRYFEGAKTWLFFLPKRSYNIDWKVNVYYLRYEVFFQGQCNMQTAYSTTLIIDKLYLLFLLEFPPIQHGLNLHEQRFLNCQLQRNRSFHVM